MEKIAIINLKGGVGKSITTINLAAEFAAQGLSVLVVDLDKQANTTKFYDRLDYSAPSTADVLTCNAMVCDAVQETDNPFITLVPANMRLLTANRQVLMDTTEPQQTRLRDFLIREESTGVDICLMDCPPDLDMGSINALCAAYWVLIPVDCDEWATDGMMEVLDQMARVRMYYNPRLKLMGVLMTKYQATNAARRAVEAVAETGTPMMQTMIRYTVRVKEARSAHLPLREYVVDSTAAQDYQDLAQEMLRTMGVSNVDTDGEAENDG